MIYQCHNTSSARCTYVDINVTFFFKSSFGFLQLFYLCIPHVYRLKTGGYFGNILKTVKTIFFLMHCNFCSIIFIFQLNKWLFGVIPKKNAFLTSAPLVSKWLHGFQWPQVTSCVPSFTLLCNLTLLVWCRGDGIDS